MRFVSVRAERTRGVLHELAVLSDLTQPRLHLEDMVMSTMPVKRVSNFDFQRAP